MIGKKIAFHFAKIHINSTSSVLSLLDFFGRDESYIKIKALHRQIKKVIRARKFLKTIFVHYLNYTLSSEEAISEENLEILEF